MLVDVVMGEVAKTVTASLAGVGLTGLGRLGSLIRHKASNGGGELPADPAELRELLLRCAAEDPEWAGQLAGELAEQVPAAIGTDPGPAFLPPRPFCDRDELRAALPETGVFGLAGPRGCGKTALVRQLAAERAARFPVHQAQLDLDDFRDGEVPRLAEAKRHVLRQLGVTEVVAAEPELTAQYVRAPLRRRVLLVVENVLGADELTALVADWPAALVLVTTRRLTRDLRAAAVHRWFEIGGLDEAGAAALLAACCPEPSPGDEPGPARELLDRFGRQPQAIRVLGGVLALRAGEPKPIAGLLDELVTAGISGTDELLGATLSGQVAQVPPEAERGFRLLAGVPAGRFTVATATVLLGRPARPTVEQLRELGLVEPPDAGRYRMSWSVRRFAAELGAPDDADAALDRLLTWYAERAVAADLAGGPRLRRYRIPEPRPVWPDGEDRIGWLDAEAEVLAELVETAYVRGRDDEVGRLCGALEVLALHRGRHELGLAAYDRGVLAARRQGDRPLLARQHALAGRAATLLHRFDRARAELAAARTVAGPLGDVTLTASIAEFTARLAEEEAGAAAVPDWRPAIEAFGYALDLDRADPAQQRARGLHARMLANVLVKAGRPAEALPLLAEAAASTLPNDDRNAARVHTVLAKCHAVLGDLAAARAELTRAVTLTEAVGAGQYDAELADLTAEIEFREGRIGAARSRWAALAQDCLRQGHPRAAEYTAKLSWPPPAR